MFVKIETNGV